MRRQREKNLIILLFAVVLAFLLVFAGISVSKFVFDDKKELVGVYTDFVLSHDGEGQTAIIRTAADGSSVGFIAVTVNNFTEEKVSKRDVRFSLREPTAKELENGKVSDAWENEFSLEKDSGNYEIEIVKESGEGYSEEELREIAFLKAKTRSQSTVLIKITRTATGEMPSTGTETLSVILETSEPYRDLQVFTINAAKTRISVGVATDVYQGYEQKTVNLKTAVDFLATEGAATAASYRAKIVITITGEAVFDAYRFKESFGNGTEEESGYTFTFYVEPGADLYLYFYVKGASSANISAWIDNSGEYVSENVSGTGNDGLLFAKV